MTIARVGRIEVLGTAHVHPRPGLVDLLNERFTLTASRAAPPVAALIVAAVRRVIQAAVVRPVCIRTTVAIDRHAGLENEGFLSSRDGINRTASDRIDFCQVAAHLGS